MQNDSSGNDPRIMWQNQSTEASAMTLERIRQKTKELRAKTRRDLIKSIAGPLVVVAICGFGIRFHDPVLRTILAFAIVWSLTGQYFLNRGMWSPTPPEEAAWSTGLRVLPAGGRAAAFSFFPHPAVADRAVDFRNRHINCADREPWYGKRWNAPQTSAPQDESLPDPDRHLDRSRLRDQDAAAAGTPAGDRGIERD